MRRTSFRQKRTGRGRKSDARRTKAQREQQIPDMGWKESVHLNERQAYKTLLTPGVNTGCMKSRVSSMRKPPGRATACGPEVWAPQGGGEGDSQPQTLVSSGSVPQDTSERKGRECTASKAVGVRRKEGLKEQ